MKELQVAEIVRVLVLSWKHEYFKHELNLFPMWNKNTTLYNCCDNIYRTLIQLKLHLIFLTEEHIVLFLEQ